ncbi:hypothetical protein BDV93DRAFT_517306 [Ceratobasidium sp. AG-I]|nr:hypothetical protein BDV93DRAFT_517306 [Ceratobasidium sp. AG-I]
MPPPLNHQNSCGSPQGQYFQHHVGGRPNYPVDQLDPRPYAPVHPTPQGPTQVTGSLETIKRYTNASYQRK